VNLVIAAAGRLDHGEVVDAVARCLPNGEAGSRPDRHAPTQAPSQVSVVRRPTEQAHLTLGWRGLAHDDPDRYALAVANQVLGGGMSSRLFQEVREERGLAYAVYSYISTYADAGTFVVYAGTSPAKVAEVRKVVDGELDRFRADGITAQELAVATGYLEGAMLLGLEDSASRMARLGRSMITRGEIVAIDEHIARIRAVTVADVARVIARVLDGQRVLAAVGPFDEAALA